MSDTSRQPPVLPAQNGRHWTSIAASGLAKKIEWGSLLVLAGALGGFLYMQHVRDQTVLANQAIERKAHFEQIDKILQLVINEVIDEQKRVASRLDNVIGRLDAESEVIKSMAGSITEIRTVIIEMRERQENFVPVLNRLLGIRFEPKRPETTPPGRVRGLQQPLGDERP